MFQDIFLILIILLVLILPLTVHKVEENLELFLFICGVSAVSISGVWSWHLLLEAATEPIKITAAVIILGFLFKRFSWLIQKRQMQLVEKIGFKWFMFLCIIVLGFMSSIITAIIAAIMLSEFVGTLFLGLKKESKVRFVVLACFAIGIGAAFTPVGEPLATIVISKLSGEPHNADFFFLLKLLGPWLAPSIILMAALSFFLVKQEKFKEQVEDIDPGESYKGIAFRGIKVYFFIAALVFLGQGLLPLALKTILKLPDGALYWANSISAILDNATLAAIEIVPDMESRTLLFLLTGLILAGGLLVPGNIPNIICAGKLKIKNSEWAKFAVPLGLVFMVIYFVLLEVVKIQLP